VTVNLTIKGLEGFKKNLPNLAQLRGFGTELDRSAQAVAATAAEILSDITSENSSGRLASSLTVTAQDGEFSRRIGTELNYAAFIEFGTVKTPPRPWLSSALALEKPAIKTRLGKLLINNATAKS